MALDGLAVGLIGLEGRRCCSVSVWESEESESWASAVCSLSLARGSVHRLPGDLTCASGADSDLTWLWRGKGQCERGDEELMGVCHQLLCRGKLLTPADIVPACIHASVGTCKHMPRAACATKHMHTECTQPCTAPPAVTYGPVPERLGAPLLRLG